MAQSTTWFEKTELGSSKKQIKAPWKKKDTRKQNKRISRGDRQKRVV